MIKRAFLCYIIVLVVSYLKAQELQIISPNGDIELIVQPEPEIVWSVNKNGMPILDKASLSLELSNGQGLGKMVSLLSSSESENNEIIKPVVPYKFSEIIDHYRELVLKYQGYQVEFRVYNDGIAYRFVVAQEGEINVLDEEVYLQFATTPISHFPMEESYVSHYERLYHQVSIDTLHEDDFCSLPVIFTFEDDTRLLFTETNLRDYPGMFLHGTQSNALSGNFPPVIKTIRAADGNGSDRNQVILEEESYIAKTDGSRAFPWRVCIIGDDKTVLESTLTFQMADPNELEETSWIKPGLVAWDWYNALNLYGVDFEAGINNRTYQYYIDFAAQYGLDYIILDEGWSASTTNILEPRPEIDVKELVEYGRNKGVGVILWLLWKPVQENLNAAFGKYHGWGVKGVKIDFMQRTDQDMVNYYETVARKAAEHELLVDYHGAFKPSGLQRTYPNVISFEGVKGNENNKWSRDVSPEHTLILPFTRMVAGPMDFTPGAMSNAQAASYRSSFLMPMSLGTRCHQAAMYVVFESPLQMFCDLPTKYMEEPEYTSILSKVHTTWDETIALEAKLSDYVVIARRKGEDWYIGAMTDWSERDFTIDLSFLGDGVYMVDIISDGLNANRWAEDYKIEKTAVTKESKLNFHLARGGGWYGQFKKQ